MLFRLFAALPLLGASVAVLTAGGRLASAAPSEGIDPTKAVATATKSANQTVAAAELPAGKRMPAVQESAIPKTGYLRIEKSPNHKPILVIQYPWKAHGRPSVELRMLEPQEEDRNAWTIRPLRFVAEYMKAEVTNTLFDALDHGAKLPFTKKLNKLGRDFEVIGRLNELGKSGVTVVFPAAGAKIKKVPRAVYYLLDSWAFDKKTLRLELPADFAEPGELRVWFLRESNLVWDDTINWPGLGK